MYIRALQRCPITGRPQRLQRLLHCYHKRLLCTVGKGGDVRLRLASTSHVAQRSQSALDANVSSMLTEIQALSEHSPTVGRHKYEQLLRTACGREHSHKDIMAVWTSWITSKRVELPGVVFINMVIAGQFNRSHFEMQSLLEDLEKYALPVESSTIRLLMRCCGRVSGQPEKFILLKFLSSRDLLNIDTLSTFLEVMASEGDVEACVKLFGEIRELRNGAPPSLEAFGYLTSVFCFAPNWASDRRKQEIVALLTHAEAGGHELTEAFFVSLIDACVVKSNPEGAMRIYEIMQENNIPLTDPRAFVVMMLAQLPIDLNIALGFYEDFLALGGVLEPNILSNVLKELSARDEIQTLLVLLDNEAAAYATRPPGKDGVVASPMSPAVLQVALFSCLHHARWDDAVLVFTDAQDGRFGPGCVPDVSCLHLFLLAKMELGSSLADLMDFPNLLQQDQVPLVGIFDMLLTVLLDQPLPTHDTPPQAARQPTRTFSKSPTRAPQRKGPLILSLEDDVDEEVKEVREVPLYEHRGAQGPDSTPRLAGQPDTQLRVWSQADLKAIAPLRERFETILKMMLHYEVAPASSTFLLLSKALAIFWHAEPSASSPASSSSSSSSSSSPSTSSSPSSSLSSSPTPSSIASLYAAILELTPPRLLTEVYFAQQTTLLHKHNCGHGMHVIMKQRRQVRTAPSQRESTYWLDVFTDKRMFREALQTLVELGDFKAERRTVSAFLRRMPPLGPFQDGPEAHALCEEIIMTLLEPHYAHGESRAWPRGTDILRAFLDFDRFDLAFSLLEFMARVAPDELTVPLFVHCFDSITRVYTNAAKPLNAGGDSAAALHDQFQAALLRLTDPAVINPRDIDELFGRLFDSATPASTILLYHQLKHAGGTVTEQAVQAVANAMIFKHKGGIRLDEMPLDELILDLTKYQHALVPRQYRALLYAATKDQRNTAAIALYQSCKAHGFHSHVATLTALVRSAKHSRRFDVGLRIIAELLSKEATLTYTAYRDIFGVYALLSQQRRVDLWDIMDRALGDQVDVDDALFFHFISAVQNMWQKSPVDDAKRVLELANRCSVRLHASSLRLLLKSLGNLPYKNSVECLQVALEVQRLIQVHDRTSGLDLVVLKKLTWGTLRTETWHRSPSVVIDLILLTMASHGPQVVEVDLVSLIIRTLTDRKLLAPLWRVVDALATLPYDPTWVRAEIVACMTTFCPRFGMDLYSESQVRNMGFTPGQYARMLTHQRNTDALWTLWDGYLASGKPATVAMLECLIANLASSRLLTEHILRCARACALFPTVRATLVLTAAKQPDLEGLLTVLDFFVHGDKQGQAGGQPAGETAFVIDDHIANAVYAAVLRTAQIPWKAPDPDVPKRLADIGIQLPPKVQQALARQLVTSRSTHAPVTQTSTAVSPSSKRNKLPTPVSPSVSPSQSTSVSPPKATSVSPPVSPPAPVSTSVSTPVSTPASAWTSHVRFHVRLPAAWRQRLVSLVEDQNADACVKHLRSVNPEYIPYMGEDYMSRVFDWLMIHRSTAVRSATNFLLAWAKQGTQTGKARLTAKARTFLDWQLRSNYTSLDLTAKLVLSLQSYGVDPIATPADADPNLSTLATPTTSTTTANTSPTTNTPTPTTIATTTNANTNTNTSVREQSDSATVTRPPQKPLTASEQKARVRAVSIDILAGQLSRGVPVAPGLVVATLRDFYSHAPREELAMAYTRLQRAGLKLTKLPPSSLSVQLAVLCTQGQSLDEILRVLEAHPSSKVTLRTADFEVLLRVLCSSPRGLSQSARILADRERLGLGRGSVKKVANRATPDNSSNDKQNLDSTDNNTTTNNSNNNNNNNNNNSSSNNSSNNNNSMNVNDSQAGRGSLSCSSPSSASSLPKSPLPRMRTDLFRAVAVVPSSIASLALLHNNNTHTHSTNVTRGTTHIPLVGVIDPGDRRFGRLLAATRPAQPAAVCKAASAGLF